MSGYGRGRGGPGVAEEQAMQAVMFKLMMGITKGCFTECVNSFKEDKISSSEQTCLKNCSFRQADAMKSMQEIQSTLASKAGGGMGGF